MVNPGDFTITLSGIIIGLGIAFGSKKLLNMGKEELIQGILSAALVGLFMSLITSTDTVALSLLPPVEGATGSVSYLTTLFSHTLTTVDTVTAKLVECSHILHYIASIKVNLNVVEVKPFNSLDNLGSLLDGQVKIFKASSDGKEQILHILGPGEPFGEVPVFSGQQFPASAEALRKSRLIFFPRSDFVNLITANPSLALNMLAVLSMRLRQFTVQIENLSLKEVPGRLATYLIYLAGEQPYLLPERPRAGVRLR